MKTSDFDFHLPETLIAQTPLENRSASRLLVVNKTTKTYSDYHFEDLTDFLKKGDIIVRNNTRVIPARLFGIKKAQDNNTQKDGHCEVLLLKDEGNNVWQTLVGNAKIVKLNTIISFGDDKLKGRCVKIGVMGIRYFKMIYEGIFMEVIDQLGNIPLPPYIKEKLIDKERYQTVYSKVKGSAAAPTAGLHFTEELIEKLYKKGCRFVDVTLHIGLATFRPVSVDNVDEHRTDIFIYPGYEFKVTDAIITNFHLPKSTLIMMICAFGGKDLIFKAYHYAIEEKYRFFSFGDSMFIY